MSKRAESYDLSRSQWEALIDEWIFSERDRAIIKRRLLDGICLEPLAEEFYLSVQQTKTIVYKAQEKLFKHL
jgi:DNA-directed RNA polymerase sigma subunit (sigma70/sigma32)